MKWKTYFIFFSTIFVLANDSGDFCVNGVVVNKYMAISGLEKYEIRLIISCTQCRFLAIVWNEMAHIVKQCCFLFSFNKEKKSVFVISYNIKQTKTESLDMI